jgi:uptake hydrogenase large subunit
MSRSFDPGSVCLRLHILGGRVAAADVACERPEVTRLLHGQQADRAVALVPLIYSLCGKAQGVAARTALAAARGEPAEPHVDADVLAEAAREHAWKLLVDWPRQLGLDADEPLFVRVSRAQAQERPTAAQALRSHSVFAAMRDSLLPSEHAIDRFVLDRIEARLAQLVDYLDGRTQGLGSVVAAGIGAGRGRSTVETARGALLHELALDGDRIASYRITAPTDIHFAADGMLASWLEQLQGLPRAEADVLAARAVMALDPCVPWRCESC